MCADTCANKSVRMICLVLCLFMMTGAIGFAQETTLSDIVVDFTKTKVLFSTTIKNAFNEKMEDAAKNGIPVTFSFIIVLDESRKMWPDREVSEKQATHTMTYDPLTGKYLVTRSWEKKNHFITASFEEACDRMCKIEGMRLTRTKKLNKGSAYVVRAKAKLEKISLPLYLDYVLFFVSFWDVETDWQETSFTYKPDQHK